MRYSDILILDLDILLLWLSAGGDILISLFLVFIKVVNELADSRYFVCATPWLSACLLLSHDGGAQVGDGYSRSWSRLRSKGRK